MSFNLQQSVSRYSITVACLILQSPASVSRSSLRPSLTRHCLPVNTRPYVLYFMCWRESQSASYVSQYCLVMVSLSVSVRSAIVPPLLVYLTPEPHCILSFPSVFKSLSVVRCKFVSHSCVVFKPVCNLLTILVYFVISISVVSRVPFLCF